MYSLLGLRVVATMAFHDWLFIVRANAKSAFLKTDKASWNIYVFYACMQKIVSIISLYFALSMTLFIWKLSFRRMSTT